MPPGIGPHPLAGAGQAQRGVLLDGRQHLLRRVGAQQGQRALVGGKREVGLRQGRQGAEGRWVGKSISFWYEAEMSRARDGCSPLRLDRAAAGRGCRCARCLLACASGPSSLMEARSTARPAASRVGKAPSSMASCRGVCRWSTRHVHVAEGGEGAAEVPSASTQPVLPPQVPLLHAHPLEALQEGAGGAGGAVGAAVPGGRVDPRLPVERVEAAGDAPQRVLRQGASGMAGTV